MKSLHQIKVLYVAPLPPSSGGMVTYILGLLSSSVSQQVDMHLVRLDYLGKERFRGIVRIVINILNALILTAVFLVRAVQWQPDIVHIQTNSGFGFFEKCWIAILAKLVARKTLLHVHGGYMRDYYIQSPSIMKKLILWCAGINDRVIVATPRMRETWLLIGLPEEKVTLVGSAVNLPAVRKNNDTATSVTILFLTRIVYEKGIIELIDAVRCLYQLNLPIRLRIVGAEELETAKIKDYLDELKAEEYIEYVGPVSDTQKASELLKADIFAVPSYIEDLPYAVMEAMSYGLPCVTSAVGGIPSLILNEKNGILIPPKDVNALASAIQRLVQNPDLRAQLGANARTTISNEYSWTERGNEMIALYRSLV